jgi:alpha-ketoglutarate-dependent taurine dioxygenase
MTHLETRALSPAFGAEVIGFDPRRPFDDASRRRLQGLFDDRGLLLFRGLELSHPEQVRLCKMLIRKEELEDGEAGPEIGPEWEDNFYISNKRPDSAVPFGRLQFHSDTMWADQPFEVLSLYAMDVEAPVVPTMFVSAAHAWTTMPADLRARIEGLDVLQTAGEVRRGDLTDVVVTTVERPPTTVTHIAHRHPRTGETILYLCEQMTKEVVGLSPSDSECLLDELFVHLYDPANQWSHPWRNGDLIVWDNIAIQHARQSVRTDGPARTLRKVATPIPQLSLDQLPSYSTAD